MPLTQYNPIEKVAIRLVEVLQKDVGGDWTVPGIAKSTLSKALVSLEDIGFIRRTSTRSLEVLPKGKEFVVNPEKRSQVFAEGALRLKS